MWSDGDFTVTTNTDGVYLAWTSSIGIDPVFVKGGPGQLYVYDPPAEDFGDGGLFGAGQRRTRDDPAG